jgi:C-terminal processing protease CtpA/Prc
MPFKSDKKGEKKNEKDKGQEDTLRRKHWSVKCHESLVFRNEGGNFCLNIEGGAEEGLFPLIGDIKQDRIKYHSGKVLPGEVILEVNKKRVPGMIRKDVIALIRRSSEPLALITVKLNATITKDVRQYLATRFTKNSVDNELQQQIRRNLYTRVVPCTTRPPRGDERPGIDYNFISVEEFKRLEQSGALLESGVFEGNFYGTPKPSSNPPMMSDDDRVTSPSDFPTLGRSVFMQQNAIALGPLPSNWEIAYTEDGKKYFIDHNTETTHWLDPRLSRVLKHEAQECEDDELPYGWEQVIDPVYGVYYINHITRTTQYENPVNQMKRLTAGQKFIQQQMSAATSRPQLPPIRDPPSWASTAAMQKRREADAARLWPQAGFGQFNPEEEEDMRMEANLGGEVVRTTLVKNHQGFGFTIVGGDQRGDLLHIKSIVPGSVSDVDGHLAVGDVIVRINGSSVLNLTHKEVVDLFHSLPLHSNVSIECRRRAVSDEQRPPEPATREPPTNQQNMSFQSNGFDNGVPGDIFSVDLIRGPAGFGLSVVDTPRGHMVKQIMDGIRCADLKVGDLLLEVNGLNVSNLQHSDLVTLLKRQPRGEKTTFTLLRGQLVICVLSMG